MLRTRFVWQSLTFVVLGLFIGSPAFGQDRRPPVAADQAAEELTRGPIHEAFGQPTVFNPQAGLIAPKAPPELIEEVPPDQKPEGDHVTWIPGYWHWDDEGKNFIWVSGFWRSVPPDRTWVGGYWTKMDEGNQWVSGYWAPATATEVEYLPPPPQSLETGPNTEATVEGQIWLPGCWIWQETRYVWRPGFWAAGNAEWVWVPAHYLWTPGGYVFIEGYWDYPLFNRGLLFTPVAFTSIRPGFVYTPSVVIDYRFLVASLFVRPAYHHYFFGDYYDATYTRAGIYPWYAFHMSRYGYDPLYAQTRYVYSRRDPRWETQLRESFVARRETEAARPPHTFRAFTEWSRKSPDTALALARPLREVAGSRDFPVRVERVDERRLEVVRNQTKRVKEFRDARAKSEQELVRETATKGAANTARSAPKRVKMPEAPKLTPTTSAKGAATAPPAAPRTPELRPGTPQPEPKSKARTLPDPEDVVRPAKERPTPKGKGTEPPGKEPPVTVPPKKDREPPVTVPPKNKDREPPPKTEPPKREPPPKTEPPKSEPPPKKAPPKKDKDKDKDG